MTVQKLSDLCCFLKESNKFTLNRLTHSTL